MDQQEGRSDQTWHGHFEPKRVPVGVWIRCDGCQATLFRKQLEQNLIVCPECNHHLPSRPAERIISSWMRTHSRNGCRPPARRPTGVQRPSPLSRAGQGRAGGDRAERGRGRRSGIHPWNTHRVRHHRQQFHHGQHGVGRRREADPGHRGSDPAASPARDRLGLRRRRPDARGDFLPDADGEGLNRLGPLS